MYLFLDGSKSLELYSHLNPLVNVKDENDDFPKKKKKPQKIMRWPVFLYLDNTAKGSSDKVWKVWSIGTYFKEAFIK